MSITKLAMLHQATGSSWRFFQGIRFAIAAGTITGFLGLLALYGQSFPSEPQVLPEGLTLVARNPRFVIAQSVPFMGMIWLIAAFYLKGVFRSISNDLLDRRCEIEEDLRIQKGMFQLLDSMPPHYIRSPWYEPALFSLTGLGWVSLWVYATW